MPFTETVRLKLYWNTTYTTEPDGTITVQRDAPDGYLIIDRMLDFSELVDKDIGASTSGGRTVEDNEDGDEDGDEDEDKDENADEDEDEDGGGVESSDDEYVPSNEDSDDDTDFESSSSVPYVFDDISGWDKTLEEVDCDGIKMWDGNPLTLGLDIHFANKPEAQAAVGEWNLVHGRTFRVKTSSKRTWYDECETYGPKYPKEHLHSYDCLWKVRVSLQKATDTWKMVTVLPPKPMKMYEEAGKKSLRQKVNRFSKRNQKYEVVTIAPDNQPWKAEEKQVVLYANRECTCGRWQTFRFPCSHALRVARELGDDPLPLFDPCYTMHQWYQQFSGEFNPIMEPWPKATWQIRPDDTKLVHHAGRGRKRVNRKKGVMDYISKSPRRLQTCGLSYLERMFGFRFQTEESRLTSVSITEIKTHIENNPLMDLSPDDAHLQRARCFVGWLVGGLLFSNTTRNSFPLDLVHFLHTPKICSEYSWGSAALCYLYRSMSKSSLAASAKAITGCVILLQLWAWERILTVQPKILGGDLDLSHCALGTRWSREKKVQGEIAQVAERALSVNATNVVRHDLDRHVESSLDGQSIHYTSNFLSSMFEGVAGQHQADDPAEGERESQGEDEAEDEAEDADQDDQFEGQGYQRHEEQGSSQTLGTPPLAVSKGQRVTKEPDRLTYSLFRAKKPKKKSSTRFLM
ncbi:OLC1v1015978C1 [Oldenlandia corymbosa var. corymbosa]|uniref:OLC1v1015978C1 n=1 Tax=Oldenlandia corymbosa var. corymbosa TaxID=529605 RepID=A0AAV1E6I0_OLDCO|nr:OLC1v1015978C1 [Oldenlandia corymbosa var. corymbosa]